MPNGYGSFDKLSELIRNDSMNVPPRELLQKSPRSLLGVSEDAENVLKSLEIETIFDLASSGVFRDASKIVEAASDFHSALSQHGAPTSDMVRESEVAGKSIKEIQFLSITALQRIPEEEITTKQIRSTLDVESIRDLAFYPPFRAAVTLLNKIYFPENELDYDPERPADLLPKSGEYPTERVQYSTLLLDEIPLNDGVQITDIASKTFKPIDLAILAKGDAGFKKPAYGALITFNQSWYVQGVTLGHLLHSTALAAGESTRIAVIDWSRKSRAGETEIIDETDDLSNEQSQNRSISEVTKAVANEAQGGFSATNTSSQSIQASVATAMEMSAPLGGLFGGPSGSAGTTTNTAFSSSHADSYSNSWGHRDLGSSMNQNVNDRTHQHAHSNRSRRASVVKEVAQSEHESVSTRVIANYNHMHALTVQYYEVVQIYRVETSIAKADQVIFIPFALIDFNDDSMISQFQGVLARAAITNEIRESLKTLETCEITLDEKTHVVNLTTSVSQYTTKALKSQTSLSAMMKVGSVVGGGDIKKKTTTKTSVKPTALQSISLLQHINEQLWSGKQASRLSGLLNFSVLRPASNSLFLPTDVLIEEAMVESDDTPVGVVFYDTNNKVISNVDTNNPVSLNRIGRIALSGSNANKDISVEVTLTINRNGVRFPVELPSVKIKKAVKGETRLVKVKVGGVNVNLKKHLMDHRMYYSQAAFRSLDASQIAMLLSGFGVETDVDGGKQVVPVAQLVEPRPIRIIGNYLAFRMNSDPKHNKKWSEWLKLRGIHIGSTAEDLIPLGTGGVFAEAVLGRSNCAEKLDITRFWNWQDSPIPLQPTEIAVIQTGSRAISEDIKPGQLSTPIVNITSPASLPDPTGTAAALAAIQNGNMFRDMSGLQATIGLAQSALQSTAAGASTAGEQAGTNMNNLLKANTERQRIAAEMVTSLAKTAASVYTGGLAGGGGGGITPGGNHSQDGAKINYFDKTKQQSTPATSTGGGSSSGVSPSLEMGGSSSGGGSTSGSNITPTSTNSGYSQNPAALAATWGDSKPRSAIMEGVIDRFGGNVGTPAGGPTASTWSIDFVWDDVTLMNQTTNVNCWATCAAMVSSWDARTSVPIKDTPAPADIDDAANRYNLVVEPPVSHSLESFIDLLRTTGPQWVSANQAFSGGTGFHAVVVTGIYSNGNPDGSDTYLYILDPWDRAHGSPGHPGAHLGTHNAGSRYSISWSEFIAEFSAAASSQPGWMWVRLMHSANTGGRSPSPGASTSPIN